MIALHRIFHWNTGLISSIQKNLLNFSICCTLLWEIARIHGCGIKYVFLFSPLCLKSIASFVKLMHYLLEELSILVKLLGDDAPQMAMAYILTQVAIEKDPEAEWQRSLWWTIKLPFSPLWSFVLFSKLYTQFIGAKMLIDKALLNTMDVKKKQCQVILLLNFIFLIINNQR